MGVLLCNIYIYMLYVNIFIYILCIFSQYYARKCCYYCLKICKKLLLCLHERWFIWIISYSFGARINQYGVQVTYLSWEIYQTTYKYAFLHFSQWNLSIYIRVMKWSVSSAFFCRGNSFNSSRIPWFITEIVRQILIGEENMEMKQRVFN